jgi:uncharacterized protein (DUF1330 family)
VLINRKQICAGILALAGINVVLVSGVGAQPKSAMPAYVMVETKVHDTTAFGTYAEREGVLIQQFGGKFLVRGGHVEPVVGPAPEHRITVYMFDSVEKARAWRDAPEQKELAGIRDKSSEFRSFIVEGCSTCKPPGE